MKFLEKIDNNWNKFFAILLIIVAVVYDISPIDFIPDVAPIMGWADDIVATFIALINAYINWRRKI